MVLRIHASFPNCTGGTVPAADLRPIGPLAADPAVDVYEHWIFGEGPASLRGLRYGRVLTPQAAGHSWHDKYLTMPGSGNAMISDLPDGGERTMMIAVKIQASGAYYGPVMAGAWAGTEGDYTGSALYFNSTPNQALLQSSGAASFVTRTSPTGYATGDWIILGLSESVTAPGGAVFSYVHNAGNGPPDWAAAPVTGAKDVDASKLIAFGNAYFPLSFTTNPVELAQAALWDHALSPAELVAAGEVFARNMDVRGLSVL